MEGETLLELTHKIPDSSCLGWIQFYSFHFSICFSKCWSSGVLSLISVEWPDFKRNQYGMRRLGLSWEREIGTKGGKEKFPAFCISPVLYPAAQEYPASELILPGDWSGRALHCRFRHYLTESSQWPFELNINYFLNPWFVDEEKENACG